MRTRSAFLSLTVLSSTLILGACGYAVESSNQDITFVSPNAQGAKCFVMVDKRKYQVSPPQTINIKKSPKDMIVSCDAPGNRHVEITVPAKFETRAIWGTPAGMAWDYASQSLHYYPDLIAIDFSQEEVTPNVLPMHNNDDVIQPEEHNLEELLPTQPMLNKDKNHVHTPLKRKGGEDEEVVIELQESDIDMESDKGDLQAVIEDLAETPTEVLKEEDSGSAVSKAMNEEPATSDISASGASDAPVELFPGQ